MVISSLVVDSLKGETDYVVTELEKIEGVEVHEVVDFKIVVTIESETVDSSAKIAESFMDIKGVFGTELVYFNFEDDPSLQGE